MPVLQMMRAYFGIEPDDSDRRARERIAGRLLLLDPGFADDLGLVFDFLAVPDPDRPAPVLNPEARQRRLLHLVRGLVQARDRDEVSVSLLEDLHWIDSASEEFLRALVEAAPGHQDAGGHQLPSRVPRRVDAPHLLPPASARAARPRGAGRAARRPARARSLARRARRADPRADRRQPVLRRGGGSRARRVRGAQRRAGRLPAGPPDRRDLRAADGPDDPRRPHRPARRRGQGSPSGGGDDRQGVRRACCCISPPSSPRPSSTARSASWSKRSSSTRRRSIPSPSTRFGTR